MKIAYLSSEYVSHAKAALGNRAALARLGVRFVDDPEQADVVVLHDEPPNYPDYMKAHPVLRQRHVVAYAVWETTQLPPSYVNSLDGIDEIWTASSFTEALFSAVHPRVFRVPHLVREPIPDAEALERMRKRIDWQEDVFYFFTIADAANPRKNLAATLRVFDRLRKSHDVRLIIKQYARTDPRLGEHPDIISICEPLHEQDIDALHTLADAYVSSHCAEAWGLGMSEAMGAGTPVIATAYSGNLDYMTPDRAHLVNYTLRPLNDEEIAFAPALWSKDMSWAAIDEEDLLATMTRCVDIRDHDPRANAGKDVLAAFGLDSLASCLADRIRAFPQKTRSAAAQPLPAENSVGMFHQCAGSDSVIVGRTVAVDQLLFAFASRGKQSYALFAPEEDTARLNERYAENPRVGVWNHDALQARPAFAAWHEPQFLTHEPFALRSSLGAKHPISIGHHTLSYRELLHDNFLPLLLSQPRSYDSIVCTSSAAREACRRVLNHTAECFNTSYGTQLTYAGRFDLIPLPVDTERFKPGDPLGARQAFQLPADAFILLWVGRLSAIDKADLLPLLQVLSRLRVANPKADVMLVCAGRQRAGERFGDHLQDYASQLGLGPALRVIDDLQEGLPQLYRAADVFVSPADNLQESFGITPIEAMASGVPQVVSDWNGYRDSVVDGETGFLVPSYWAACHDDLGGALSHSARDHLQMVQTVVTDLQAMQARLQQLLDRPSLRRAMSDASRARALLHYGFTSVVTRYEALWAELADEAKNTDMPPTTPSYRDANYTTVFGHYPTRMLAAEQVLRLSISGLALAQGRQGLPLYYNQQWRLLDEKLLRRIMEGATKMHEKNQGLSLERMVRVIAKGQCDERSRQEIVRHAMWLLKQGFLELESAHSDDESRSR